MKHLYLYLFCLTVLVSSCCVSRMTKPHSKSYSPYYFGLAEAQTGVERYIVLLKTHQAALAAGKDVDYSGIERIDIEIPNNFRTIPLTRVNDFKGCVINVKNTSKKVCLFTAKQEGRPILVKKAMIDGRDFRSLPELRRGKVLLLIEDENPWVQNRRGHDYGHQRQDILLLKKGRARNTVVMPYNNNESSPVCKFVKADSPLVIRNLTVSRDKASTYITNVVTVNGFDDVHFSKVTINTPESDMSGDAALRILNSTDVTITDVNINGTYSQVKKSGYGISLGNVWNFKATRLNGKGNWGIFGNNNVNTATIEDSEINRFDIHCYGRDVSFRNVKFYDLYNQFSSVFGCVSFDNCEFKDFTPVLIETSYNAYTAFDVNFNDCVFYTTSKKDFLVNTGSLSGDVNTRSELSEKQLPRVNVNNMKVISLDTGEAKEQVDIFLKRGNFIRERRIQNVIKL